LFIVHHAGYNDTEDITQEDRDESILYFPLRFLTNKILLAEAGDVENIFDRYTGILKTYPYPHNLAIPQQELIVRKETTEKTVLSTS
jgi:hypothetical protein